ncbi:MAG: hypothetical protein JZU65_13870, partial [Chlorobium sp.]|nr:hypothetical protein [Chlorobium sp.]
MKKYKNRFSFDMGIFDSPYAIWFLAIWIMAVLAIIKLLYIFFMTRRGVALGWPFDSYLFDPMHRFTDWIIPYIWSEEINPWKENHPLLKSLPPSPYGPITFAYLRVGHIVGPIASFVLAIFAFLYFSYRLLLESLPSRSENRILWSVFIYTILILVFYPVHFLIDRGNADVIPAIFIAGIFLIIVNVSSGRKHNYIFS